MRLLDRYIIGRVTRATALALLVLSVLMALFLYVNEQGWVGVGRYGNLQALRHVLFMLPATLLPFLPVAVLLGALLAAGQLARGSELTVIRAAGVSVAHIGRAIAVAGLLLLPIALLIGEFVAPPLARIARETRALERDGSIGLTPRAVWLRDGQRILRADAAAGGGFTLFELDEDFSLAGVSQAQRVRSMPDGNWQLDDVRGTRVKADRTSAWSGAGEVLHLAAGADFFSLATTRPDEMSLQDLARVIGFLDANGLDDRRHRFAFWGAIARLAALPLAALLALPLVMGRLRGAENAGRVSAGLALGLFWYLAQRMVESGALAFGISPSLMALLPTALLALAVVWLLSRLPRVPG